MASAYYPCLLSALLLLAACSDREAGEIEPTAAERARAEASLRQELVQPDPAAVAVGLKYDLGADTVLALVSGYARYHDLPLRVRLASAGAPMPEPAPGPLPTGRATQQALARRYNVSPALVGSLIYDYKVLARPSE